MRRVNLKILAAVCVLTMTLTLSAMGRTIYVDPNGSADFTTIQAAISDPCTIDYDEIEVAPATYNEAINFNGKAVRLYSSGGPDVTIIDATGIAGAYHVVQCVNDEDANTILEGFTITGGDANGPAYDDQRGGGMYNLQSSPTVTDCNFTGNSAINGGGVFNLVADTRLTGCTFSFNSATNESGGLHNHDCNAIVTNCTFVGNTSSNGGAMTNPYGSPTVTNCTFSGNSASDFGGGMYNRSGSTPTVTDCNFTGNTANWGGGMYNNQSSPTLTNCTFSGNQATSGGGGILNKISNNPTVTNCILSNNTADWGGGMYNYDNSSPTVTNCTFSGNQATVGGGGGILNNVSSNPTVINCILWGNTPDEIVDFDTPTSTTDVSFSDVQGVIWPGPGNIDADPLFVDAAGGDLRLSSSASLCVDGGANFPGLPATDLAGNPRVVDGDRNGTAIVDMGAYEFQALPIHNITQDRWYEIIQRAIDEAHDLDQIEVGPGTYNEAINFNGTAVRLYSSGGPDVTTIDANGIAGAYHVVQCVNGEDVNTILEGFTITGGNANGPAYDDQRGGGMYNLQSSPTVTDCNFTGNSAINGGGIFILEANNVSLTRCTFSFNSAVIQTGGLHIHSCSDAIVTDCSFISNTSPDGGGMHNAYSSPTVTNCTFSDNTADNYGGGMYNRDGSSPTVTNCTFSGNQAYGGGGMGNLNNSSPTVTNCTFSGNQAIGGGGMGNSNNSSPAVTNCTFSGNSADYYCGGGMINQTNSSPTVTNCTFSGNSATTFGGGMFNEYSSGPTVTNCILWGDEPSEIDNEATSFATVVFCDVQGGWLDANNTNIDADPLFVDANNPDPNFRNLRLKPDSPCIDAGDSTVLLAMEVYLDLDGKDRYVDIDAVADTGAGPVEFLDMGAYEFQCSGIAGDNNCDGVVNFKDMAILAGNWLAGTEP